MRGSINLSSWAALFPFYVIINIHRTATVIKMQGTNQVCVANASHNSQWEHSMVQDTPDRMFKRPTFPQFGMNRAALRYMRAGGTELGAVGPWCDCTCVIASNGMTRYDFCPASSDQSPQSGERLSGCSCTQSSKKQAATDYRKILVTQLFASC